MSSWFVKPEARRVELPEKQWLLLKKRLTEGERRQMLGGLISEVRGDGRMTPNLQMIGGKAETHAYLLDWSLCDENGHPVRIDTDDRKEAALSALDPDKFALINEAVTKHVEEMEKERAAEKNAKAGESASSATSPSVA